MRRDEDKKKESTVGCGVVLLCITIYVISSLDMGGRLPARWQANVAWQGIVVVTRAIELIGFALVVGMHLWVYLGQGWWQRTRNKKS
jgi:hypothetical protein